MSDRAVDVFFYGLFMDQDLLRRKGIAASNPRAAILQRFGLRLGKRATLVPARDEHSYGVVMTLAHNDLNELYSGEGLQHYQPEAITCTTSTGELVSALCYNLPQAPAPDEVNAEYAAQLRTLLAKLGFPADYVEGVR